MADKWPAADGNYSNAANWNGGTKPTAGDDVYADGFTITIDEDISASVNLRTTQRSGGTAGGSFTTLGTLDIVINANTYAGTTHALVMYQSTRAKQIGNSYGSDTTASKYGTDCQPSCEQYGHSYGGSQANAYGTALASGGRKVGNCYGGSGASAHGCNGGQGRSIVIGDCYGGSGGYGLVTNSCVLIGNSYSGPTGGGVGAYLNAGSIQYGNSYGGDAAHDTYATSMVSGSLQFGNSYGGGNAKAATFLAFGSVHCGNAYGGTTADAQGTYCKDQSWFVGRAFGGTNATAYGLFITNRCLLALGDVTDATSPAVYMDGSASTTLLNPSYCLFFDGVVLADITLVGTAIEIDETDPWAIASEHVWRPVFYPVVLPAASLVTKDTVYGDPEAPTTGTGLIVDSAVFAEAITEAVGEQLTAILLKASVAARNTQT